MRFLWTGNKNGFALETRQRIIDLRPEFMVLAQFHRGNEIMKQLADALHFTHDGVPTFVYFGATHNSIACDWFAELYADHPEWIIQDLVKAKKSGQLDRHLYNWENKDFQDHMVGMLSDWATRGIAGIALDSVNLLSSTMRCRETATDTLTTVGEVLNAEKITGINLGFKQFLVRLSQLGIKLVANVANGGTINGKPRFQVNWNSELWHLLDNGRNWIHSEWCFLDPRTGMPREDKEISEFLAATFGIKQHAMTANIKSDVWDSLGHDKRVESTQFVLDQFEQIRKRHWPIKAINVGPYDKVLTFGVAA